MLVIIFTLGVGAFLAIGEGHKHLDGDSHSTGVNEGVIKENWSNEEDDMEHLVTWWLLIWSESIFDLRWQEAVPTFWNTSTLTWKAFIDWKIVSNI